MYSIKFNNKEYKLPKNIIYYSIELKNKLLVTDNIHINKNLTNESFEWILSYVNVYIDNDMKDDNIPYIPPISYLYEIIFDKKDVELFKILINDEKLINDILNTSKYLKMDNLTKKMCVLLVCLLFMKRTEKDKLDFLQKLNICD